MMATGISDPLFSLRIAGRASGFAVFLKFWPKQRF